VVDGESLGSRAGVRQANPGPSLIQQLGGEPAGGTGG